jgi:hypothetical protein
LPWLRRLQRQPGSAADALKDEYRERDDDQYDENGPQHCEAPSLACLKRRNPGSRGGFASQPRRRCDEALPRESHRRHPLSRQVSRRRASTAGAAGAHTSPATHPLIRRCVRVVGRVRVKAGGAARPGMKLQHPVCAVGRSGPRRSTMLRGSDHRGPGQARSPRSTSRACRLRQVSDTGRGGTISRLDRNWFAPLLRKLARRGTPAITRTGDTKDHRGPGRASRPSRGLGVPWPTAQLSDAPRLWSSEPSPAIPHVTGRRSWSGVPPRRQATENLTRATNLGPHDPKG